MCRRSLILTVVLSLFFGARGTAQLMRVHRSSISFVSNAPLERIEAATGHASGVLDATARTFAIRVPMSTFEGFNSPLQREHFNENYVESEDHPDAQFKGRIIEAIDLSRPGAYKVRAKGLFTVHGVERERIMPCDLVVTADGVRVTGDLDVLLADHDIRVPGIVRQKIAPVVKVSVDLMFRSSAPK